jgi:hypothetical protein
LNKVDAKDISNTNLALILEPFLHAVAHCSNKILINRIIERIFTPLLENNVTQSAETTESEEEIENYDPKRGKYIDGGKLPPKTQKEI